MQVPDGNDPTGGMDFFLAHPGRVVDVSHYFRQTEITRRRETPWVNRAWCRRRLSSTKAFPWKH